MALHKAAAVHVDLELYTPGEAEAITQVSQATVRNWRRAKHLPRHEGHARYDIAELLIQASMRARVSRGVAPESAKGYSSEIAKAAFQSMIFRHKAYSAGVIDAARAEVGEIAPERIERMQEELGHSFDLQMLESVDRQSLMLATAKQTFGIKGLKAPKLAHHPGQWRA